MPKPQRAALPVPVPALAAAAAPAWRCRIHHLSKPPRPGNGCEAENVRFDATLPFVPTAGMHLKLTRDGNFLEVEDVYFDLTDPHVIQVFIAEPDDPNELESYSQMLRQGWRVDREESENEQQAAPRAGSTKAAPRKKGMERTGAT